MRCSRCGTPLVSDLVPAFDAFTGQPICDDCTRIQRHVLRRRLQLVVPKVIPFPSNRPTRARHEGESR